MAITTTEIKELRDATGVSVMQCKKALEEAGGDREKALLILRKKSQEIVDKKGNRTLGGGVVDAYIHTNKKVGALVELLCETDFVAGNDEFKQLAYEIAMHAAAMQPKYVSGSAITNAEREKMRSLFEEEVAKMDKQEDAKKKILENKVETYFNDLTLLSQPFVKNPEVTIQGLIEQATQKFGERIEVGKLAVFRIQ